MPLHGIIVLIFLSILFVLWAVWLCIHRKTIQKKQALSLFSIENSSDSVFWIDRNAKIFYVNNAACNTLGYSKSELLEKTLYDIDPQITPENWPSHWVDVKEAGTLTFESSHLTKDGKIVSVEIMANHITVDGAEFHCSFARDLTFKKHIESTILKEKEYASAILEHSFDGIAVVTNDGEIKLASPGMERMLGIDFSKIHTMEEWIDEVFAGPTEAQTARRLWALDIRAENPPERVFQLKRTDGSKCWCRFRLSRMNEDQVVMNGQDITEFISIEKALLEEKALAQTYLDIAGTAFVALSYDETIKVINKKGCEILEYEDSQELIGKNWFDVCIPEGDRSAIRGVFQSLMSGDRELAKYHENMVLTKTGKLKLVAWHNTLLIDDNGILTGILSSGSDITTQREAEAQLEESELRYRSFIEEAHDMIQSVLPDGSFAFVNRSWLNTLGYSATELPSLTLMDIIHPDFRSHCKTIIEKILAGEPIPHIEAAFISKSGEKIFVEGNASPRYMDGEVVASHAIFHNVSDRKIAENKLKHSESKLDSMLQSIPDHMSLMDKDLNIIWANDTAMNIFGQDIVGKKCYEVYHKKSDPCEPSPCLTLRTFQNGQIHEHDTQVIDKDGNMLEFHCVSNVAERDENGNPISVLEISRDITDQKRLEAALKQSENEKTLILDSMHELVLFLDVDCRIIWANKAASDVVKKSPEELEGLFCHNALFQREQPCENCHGMSAMKTGKVHGGQFKSPEGKIWNVSGYPVRNDSGKIIGVVEVFLDVTEQLESKKALLFSEEKYRILVDSAADAIFNLDKDGNFLAVNREAAKAMGKISEEMIGKNMHDFFPKEIAERQIGSVRNVISTGAPLYTYDAETQTAYGTRWYNTTLTPIKNTMDEVVSVLGISRDVTNQKMVERELLRERDYNENVINSLPGTFYLINKNNEFVKWNRNLEKISEFSDEEVKKMSPLDFIPDADKKSVTDTMADVYKTGESSVESAIKTRSGKVIPYFFTGKKVSLGDDDYLVGMGIDISDRKRAELALQDSEFRYRSTINAMGDAIHVIDAEFNVILMNDAFLLWNKKLGLSSEVLGKSIFDIYPFLGEKVREEYRQVFEKGRILITQDEISLGDELIYTDTRKIPVAENNKVVNIITVIRDITESKISEQALKESEEKFRVLAEKSPNMILIINRDKIVYANETCEEMTGYSRQELYASDFDIFCLISPSDVKSMANLIETSQKGDESVSDRHYEFSLLTKSGKTINTIYSPKLINYQGKTATLSIITDITDRKRMEASILLRNKELNAYNQVARIISRNLNITETLGDSFSKILEILNFEVGVIHLYDEAKDLLHIHHHRGLDEISIKIIDKIKMGEGIIGRAAKTRNPIVVEKASGIMEDPVLLSNKKRLASIISFPLLVHKKLLGVITFGTHESRTFKEHEVKMLVNIEEQLSLAIENSMLFEQKYHSEELYRGIFNITPVAIMTLNKDGKVDTVSPYLARVFGRGRTEDFIDKANPFEAFHHDKKSLRNLFEQMLSTGKAFERNGCEGRSITGRHLYVNVKGIPLFDDRANIIGAVVVVENVTPRRQAEIAELEMREFLERIIQQSPLAMAVFDKSGKLVMANPALAEQLGLPDIETIFGSFNILKNSYFSELRVMDKIEKVFLGETVKLPTLALQVNRLFNIAAPGEIHLDIRLFPIFDTKRRVRNVMCIFENVTEKIKMEQQILQRSRELLAFNLVAKTIGQSFNNHDILEHALDIVLEVTGLELGWIYIRDGNTDVFTLDTYRGVTADMYVPENAVLGKGIIGITASSGEPHLIKNLSEDPRVEPKELQNNGFHSFIFIPLKSKDKVFGVMPLGSYSERKFTAGDLQLLTAIGNQIGVLLENTGLYSIAQRQIEKEGMLNKIVTGMQSSLELDTVLSAVVEDLRHFLNVSRCGLFQVIGKSGGMTLTHESRDQKLESGIGFTLQSDKSPAFKSLINGEIFMPDDVTNYPEFAPLVKKLKFTSKYSLILAPVIIEKKLKGAFLITHEKDGRKWNDDEIGLVRSVASQIAVAMKNTRLYRREKEAAIKLENSNKELLLANRYQERFMALISDNLREPAIAISEILHKLDKITTNDDVKSRLAPIESKVALITMLIEGLKNLSEVDKQAKKIKQLSVNEVIKSVIEALPEDTADISFDVQGDIPPVTADPSGMRLVFYHLIDNAIKNRAANRKLNIKINYTDLEAMIEIHVQDNGIGIDNRYIKNIFDPFYRLENTSYMGSGTGLALAKRLVENFCGEIRVEASNEEGTVFAFTCPKYKNENGQ